MHNRTLENCEVACGIPVWPGAKRQREARRLLGYMPDFAAAYEDMEVGEYLLFFSSLYGIKENRAKKLVDDVLALTDLGSKRRALVGTLSRGVQQRLQLARVLIHDPKVLLLDEPASGLDPRARIEVRALLKELTRMGKTILVSSHILTELADICNVVGIIEKGRLLVSGPVEEVMARVRHKTQIIVRVRERPEGARAMLEKRNEVESVEEGDEGALVVTFAGEEAPHDFLAELLVREGYGLLELHEQETTLEDAFMSLTKGEGS